MDGDTKVFYDVFDALCDVRGIAPLDFFVLTRGVTCLDEEYYNNKDSPDDLFKETVAHFFGVAEEDLTSPDFLGRAREELDGLKRAPATQHDLAGIRTKLAYLDERIGLLWRTINNGVDNSSAPEDSISERIACGEWDSIVEAISRRVKILKI
jgi:hypothetical protein